MSDIPTANTYDGRQWVPSEDYMATFEKLCDARKRVAELEVDGHVATENLRDTFAAAALVGLTRAIPENSIYHQDIVASQAYGLADAMLRERNKTSVGAAGVAPVADRKSVATHGACARPCSQSFDSAPTTDQESFNAAVMNWISEATVIYGHNTIMAGACDQCWAAYGKHSTNHDAVPAARARTDAESDRTDKAVLRPGEGTGDPVTKPLPKEKRAEVSDGEPAGWGVIDDRGLQLALHPTPEHASSYARNFSSGLAEVVPLYRKRQPTLTDAEREAVGIFAATAWTCLKWSEVERHAATLRGLLERLGGGR